MVLFSYPKDEVPVMSVLWRDNRNQALIERLDPERAWKLAKDISLRLGSTLTEQQKVSFLQGEEFRPGGAFALRWSDSGLIVEVRNGRNCQTMLSQLETVVSEALKASERVMEDGQWYFLDPSASVGGKTFRRVICEYQVPNSPKEYSVRGVPDGGDEEEAFILRFTDKGRVRVTPAPHLRVVK